ncbi:MAG TPA: TIGR03067 domain-containing protein [Gemmataceae bacterium]|jgi:uncharacterized protein (TIGR03067 family)
MKATALLILLGGCFASLVGAEPERDAPAADLKKLQGTWVMAELEINGQQISEEKLKDTTLVIKDDQYITKIKDKTHETTFKLDPSKDPKEIDMFFPDGANAPKVGKGIYRLDGDTFKLCRAQAPGEDRPRDFVTTADSGRFVVVWKRQKP